MVFVVEVAAPPIDELPPIEDHLQIEDLGAVPDVTHENLDQQAEEENAEERDLAQEQIQGDAEEVRDEVSGEDQSGLLDETQEQKRWNRRAQQMLHTLNREFSKKKDVTFESVSKKCNRKQGAFKFYTLLILNKEKAITVSEDGLYARITIQKGEKFDDMV